MKKLLFFVSFFLPFLILCGCGAPYPLIEKIPDAENVLFAPDGRFFVTGGKNIYEIIKKEDAYLPVPLYDGEPQFTGMAFHNNYLYAIATQIKNGTDNSGLLSAQSFPFDDWVQYLRDSVIETVLIRADLTQTPLVFEEIHTFHDMFMPNGMAADTAGRLYVADETLIPKGQIVRLEMTESNPPQVSQEQWLSFEEGAVSPNGMGIKSENRDGVMVDTLYFTDLDVRSPGRAMVKKVEILPDGSPGEVVLLYSTPGGLSAPFSVFDDLRVCEINGKEGVLVTDFILRSLLFIEDTNCQKWKPDYSTPIGFFENPSSVILGRSPLFSTGEIIVTEKGVLMEFDSDYGNRVSGMRIIDLIMAKQ